MKTWLTKFRISSALDDRKPLPPAVERAVAQSTELRLFAKSAAELGQALKKAWPTLAPSSSLHGSIMRAVRSSESAAAFDRKTFWPRVIPATALLLLVVLFFFGVSHFSLHRTVVSRPAEPSALAVVSSTLETTDKLVRAMPGAAMSPLTEEMSRISCDLTNAQNFLLASLYFDAQRK